VGQGRSSFANPLGIRRPAFLGKAGNAAQSIAPLASGRTHPPIYSYIVKKTFFRSGRALYQGTTLIVPFERGPADEGFSPCIQPIARG
jgi:hypothetical protein